MACSFVYRFYTIDSLEAFARVRSEITFTSFESQMVTGDLCDEDTFASLVDMPMPFYFLFAFDAAEPSHVAGFALMAVVDAGETLYLELLCASKTRRGCRLGTQLMSRMIEYFPDVRTVKWTSLVSALSFYKQFGFEPSPRNIFVVTRDDFVRGLAAHK
jgi:GNAT superfamily N-acetyltransferase